LGLDIGSKRIGIALSDELTITAQPLEVLSAKTSEQDAKHIVGLVNQYAVSEIVVGMPFNMDGSAGTQAQKVREFIALLSTMISIPVLEWDERLSTVAADRILLEADLSRSKRRKLVDKIAAVLILQGYLDNRSRGFHL
jgi:putative Holliday junction resolvase